MEEAKAFSLSSKFTWTIQKFSTLMTKKKHYSDVFTIDGRKWRVLIFPKGNNVNDFSVYLDVADSANLPYGWSRHAQFGVSVVTQINHCSNWRKDTKHQFCARDSDWGFTSFIPLSDLHDPARGFLVNDTLIVEAEIDAEIAVCKRLETETGCVGLEDQGATQQSRPSSCVICWDAPKEGACIPCGHMAACMSCLNKIQGKKLGCPVCRAEIQQVVKIYVV